MDPSLPPPPSRQPTFLLWLLWLVANLVIPAGFGMFAIKATSEPGMLVLWGVPGLVLVLHCTSSVMIGNRHLGQGILAFLGGFVMMAGSFFIGCASMFRL